MTMTLDQAFDAHKGTAVLVPGGGAGNNGQCVQWADLVLHDVYGFPYIYTPAAKDWWYNADSLGLTTDFDEIPAGQPIKKGDFIIYDPLSAGDPQGHIDLASRDGALSDFWAYDSNWDAADYFVDSVDDSGQYVRYPALHEVHHTGALNNKIVGYLRLKGVDMASEVTDKYIEQAYLAVLGRAPSEEEIGANRGYEPMELMDGLMGSEERLKYAQRVASALAGDDAPVAVKQVEQIRKILNS